MKLVFDDQAARDLEHIHGWISKDSLRGAETIMARLRASVDHLLKFPYIGRAIAGERTREWAVPRSPYVIVYEIDERNQALVITAIFHGAQHRPRSS